MKTMIFKIILITMKIITKNNNNNNNNDNKTNNNNKYNTVQIYNIYICMY